ncbi:hypothetical protein MJO29_013943, partial [Puccinia striiformis f. sp. tritici]
PNPSLKNAEPTGWVGSALIQHSRIHGRRIPAVSTAGDQTVATAGPKPLIPRPRLQKAFRKGDFDVSVASTATSTLVVGEFICSAKAALNSQVIKGLLIQTKEPGTRDLSQKPDLSHKQIVLPVNPFMSCVLAIEPILSGSIDPVFLPWKSSQVWCLFLKKAATILAQVSVISSHQNFKCNTMHGRLLTKYAIFDVAGRHVFQNLYCWSDLPNCPCPVSI